MRLMVTAQARLVKGADGHVYGNGPTNYKLPQSYLQVFDRVILLARVYQDGAADTANMAPQNKITHFF